MAVKSVVIGAGRFRRRLKKLGRDITGETIKEMGKIVTEMHADVTTTIQNGGRTGRIYGRHQASSQGEPPKSDTGELVGAITFGVNKKKKEVVGFIRAGSDHALPLEFKPEAEGGRPFMRPLYKRWRKEASRRLMTSVRFARKKTK